MKLFGFEIDFGRECDDCRRLRIENTSLRLQLQTMGEHQVELLDEIHRIKNGVFSVALRSDSEQFLSDLDARKSRDGGGSKSDPEEAKP